MHTSFFYASSAGAASSGASGPVDSNASIGGGASLSADSAASAAGKGEADSSAAARSGCSTIASGCDSAAGDSGGTGSSDASVGGAFSSAAAANGGAGGSAGPDGAGGAGGAGSSPAAAPPTAIAAGSEMGSADPRECSSPCNTAVGAGAALSAPGASSLPRSSSPVPAGCPNSAAKYARRNATLLGGRGDSSKSATSARAMISFAPDEVRNEETFSFSFSSRTVCSTCSSAPWSASRRKVPAESGESGDFGLTTARESATTAFERSALAPEVDAYWANAAFSSASTIC
mmetsp:Transcript_19388/g.57897  ORF Transcript_19388/g.57897 Transcript_19388/m.57897 type:complete len:289 (-) Transcript_19388:64-930(-)